MNRRPYPATVHHRWYTQGMAQPHPGTGDLSTWADIADTLDNLPTIIRNHRRTRHLSLRQAARLSGLAASSIARVEAGEDSPNAETLSKLLRWLDGDTTPEETR